MIRNTLFFCIIVMLFFSCKKDKKKPVDQLPTATQTGANTFGCLINGEVYTPKGSFSAPKLFANYYNGGVYLIQAYNVDSGIFIYLKSDSSIINSTGNYPLSLNSNGGFYGKYIKPNCDMSTDTINTGMLTITHYSVNSQQRIISGTFYFTVKSSGCPDINVTDGRFDISF